MKRKRLSHAGAGARKRARHAISDTSQSAIATPHAASHPVLRRLYPHVLTLRHHLLSRLPKSLKGRRRRISQVGLPDSSQDATSIPEIDLKLGQLLDSTLVGCSEEATIEDVEKIATERQRDIVAFTQQRSQTASGTFKPGYLLQSEIVDFVIWLLFRRTASHKPSHLLCHGFQRAHKTSRTEAINADPASSIPGLLARSSNSNVRTLRGPAWSRLQALLGQGGDRIMISLLLDCAIFCPISGDSGNYYQLSGSPVSDVKPDQKHQHGFKTIDMARQNDARIVKSCNEAKSPSAITFVRSRMLYAKAALNAKGGVRFGMRHIHVLNRFPDRDDHMQTSHILRYIFPRQFNLHNVFTSRVDPRETAMPFKDYTLREKEIYQSMVKALGKRWATVDEAHKWKSRVPKRLRGAATDLVDKLRTFHHQCSYTELLRRYCPVEVSNSRPPEKASVIDMASPTAHVSAFCRAVISNVIPRGFWSTESNERIIMYWIDQFVCLRKFESMTLHQIIQRIQVTNLSWLQPPGAENSTKLSRSDFEKRKEIFIEFVYWLFDSFLIPLIRSNFHATESNVHRNRLFYFRHDIWRMLTENTLNSMRLSMFEHMPTEQTTKLLSMRPLGFSKVRLLPKQHGFRIIMNLKRRQQVLKNGAMSLGRSINTVMTPVFNVISYEKSLRPELYGCSLFSVTEMLPRLEAFKTSLRKQGFHEKSLYFAKVDVQSCFDTIPQSRLLSMVERLFTATDYRAGKHVEMSPLGPLQRLNGQHVDPLPVKRYVAHSGKSSDTIPFNELMKNKFVGGKTNTIFVNTNFEQEETKEELTRLLREHIERNLVKIGKRYYRQKTGIPQGSILSSILCNYFYAELERDVLSFALGSDSLLLRLLDDFLLITVNKQHAERFVRVMHRGHADYGVVVKPSKSLTNFAACTEDGDFITQSTCANSFPYCGITINTKTLEVNKRSERTSVTDIEDSLTVDLSKMPGQTFHRKALNGFKIQLKAMFIDMALNSVSTILANFYRSFSEAAVRCLEYVRVLSKARTTCSSLLIKTVDNITALAYIMLQRRSLSHTKKNEAVGQSVISRRQLQWLACKAFQTVFRQKQTQHRALLAWLDKSLARTRISDITVRSMLETAAIRR